MANRYYTSNSQRKISGSTGGSNGRSGSVKAIPQKQGYCTTALPGKASNGFASMKKGFKEINGYAAYKGLSQSSGGGETSFRQGSKRDQQEGVFESVMDLEGIKTPMARSVGRMEYRAAMTKERGNFSKAMKTLGGKAPK